MSKRDSRKASIVDFLRKSVREPLVRTCSDCCTCTQPSSKKLQQQQQQRDDTSPAAAPLSRTTSSCNFCLQKQKKQQPLQNNTPQQQSSNTTNSPLVSVFQTIWRRKSEPSILPSAEPHYNCLSPSYSSPSISFSTPTTSSSTASHLPSPVFTFSEGPNRQHQHGFFRRLESLLQPHHHSNHHSQQKDEYHMLANIFGKKKTVKEMVHGLKDKLLLLLNTKIQQNQESTELKLLNQELSKYWTGLKIVIFGYEDEKTHFEPKKEDIQEVVKESVQCDVLYLAIQNFTLLEFENRKMASNIINFMIKYQPVTIIEQTAAPAAATAPPTTSTTATSTTTVSPPTSNTSSATVTPISSPVLSPTNVSTTAGAAPTTPHQASSSSSSAASHVTIQSPADYIYMHPELLGTLLKGYENADAALCCGSMFRECMKHEMIVKLLFVKQNAALLNEFFKLFDYVDQTDVKIQSDALQTLKECFKFKNLCSEFIEKNYESIFVDGFNRLIDSPNYLTKRLILNYLNEMLCERPHFNVMLRYVNDDENLKLIMTRLLDRFRHIQVEAVILFKLFIKNPKKSEEIEEILYQNQHKLIKLISSIHSEDEIFIDRKEEVLSALRSFVPTSPSLQQLYQQAAQQEQALEQAMEQTQLEEQQQQQQYPPQQQQRATTSSSIEEVKQQQEERTTPEQLQPNHNF